MKLLVVLFLLRNDILFMSASFIESYIGRSVVSKCGEIQRKMRVKYSFRIKKQHQINTDEVYLFTENEVFSLPGIMNAIEPNTDANVLKELLFYKVKVKPLKDFWNSFQPNQTFNAIFSNPINFSTIFLLSGDKYRTMEVSLSHFKIISVGNLQNFSESPFGFMRNENISKIGFQNIFSIDWGYTWKESNFHPIRIYVRDHSNNGHTISFAFNNESIVDEGFAGGLNYNYSIDSAAYLNPGRSYKSSKTENHYFELRTHEGTFSLFDISYNRKDLLNGAIEELLGCPPSFCQNNRFDHIIRLHSGKQFLVYREWMWTFIKPGDRVLYEEAIISNITSRKHINKKIKPSFQFAIRHIVDGSFIDNGILYIFRNGSFLESNDDTIIDKLNAFKDYKVIETFFKGVSTQFYDALFYHKLSRTVFFILDDKYWAYSMANNGLVSGNFPKHIEELGLPHNIKIKATYVDEDVTGNQTAFYFFTDSHYILLKEFKNEKFSASKVEYFCTSTNFLGCPENKDFVCPPPPPPPNKEDTNSDDLNAYIIFMIIGIIILVVAIIAILLLVMILSKKNIPKDKKGVETGSLSSKSFEKELQSNTASSLSIRSTTTEGQSQPKTGK